VQPDDAATPLDQDEADDLIPDHITTRQELNEWEQNNIAAALSWIGSRRSQSVLSVDFVRDLHQQMFGETWRWAGTFRKSIKTIGIPPEQIQEQMRNLLADTQYQIDKGDLSADEIAVRFHHRLVCIHPFPNGNGRHARMLTDLLLRQLGAEAFIWGRTRIENQGPVREAYVAALRAADAGDYEQLWRFVRT
jgi:Fic-DOC domain mobile mystery protein B